MINFVIDCVLILFFNILIGGGFSMVSKRIVPSDYDRLEAPTKEGKPVKVEVKLTILNIRGIKETDLTFTMDAFYHQRWIDYRFENRTNGRVVLNQEWGQKIWVPDTFFKQAISGSVSNVIFPSNYYIVHENGEVFMGARLTVTLTCKMRFHLYPHDIQFCDIDIQSLSNTVDTVKLYWNEMVISHNITTIQYDVERGGLTDCSKSYTIGNFSCIRSGIVLKRRIGHFLIKKYIPSFLIVIMSFLGFWIPTDSYPARIALVVTSLLGLITQEIQTNGEINASYVVALNVWYIICIGFVFLALVEFGFAMLHFHKTNQRGNQSFCQQSNQDQTINERRVKSRHQIFCIREEAIKVRDEPSQDEMDQNDYWIKLVINRLLTSHSRNQNKVDVISRQLFPLTFASCIALYIIYIKFL